MSPPNDKHLSPASVPAAPSYPIPLEETPHPPPLLTTAANNATTSTTVNGTPKKDGKKLAYAEVEGIRYKVAWSCLLLVEM
eukprot:scaffold153640_cov52-Attheya_sp.AAC.4